MTRTWPIRAGSSADHRHAVKQDQRAGRGIPAQPAQGRALAGRVRRSRVGAAELLEAGGVAQYVFHPPACRHFQPGAVDADHVEGRVARRLRQPLPGDDDLRFLGEGRARQEPDRRRAQQKSEMPHDDPPAIWSGRITIPRLQRQWEYRSTLTGRGRNAKKQRFFGRRQTMLPTGHSRESGNPRSRDAV
jgi:hypothetical protein